jgi:DNA polymerase-4
VAVEPRFSAYVEASKAVFALFEQAAPVVEALSIDEAFLDVRGLERFAGRPEEIAARLRREVREQVDLPITVGVARTKHLAKVASGVAKPDGLLVVPPEGEVEFLHPLPVERLWGVGPRTAEKLHARGIETVGQIARHSEATLVSMLGRAAGRHVNALAHNRDPRAVRSGRRRGSFGSQCAMRATSSFESLDPVVIALSDRVTRRMRAKGRSGRTVVLRMRFGDFTRASRSRTLPRPTAATETVLATARRLLAGMRPAVERRSCTLIGVAVSGLDGTGMQLELPLDGPDTTALDEALDAVRDRFGVSAVTRAGLLRRGPRLAAWLFPGEDYEA